ncbi:MBL fold metallo-hydrolase [Rugosimonospora africana]|uniref:MBL fold hydrolase n=1 Tax=Rugosimonospora africana TaxID=556532 RepID=A0A8J3VS52_9ACTN|nr:MBL fold metallo-hydrolase [Rugosimonospora africana]GIH16196.1 MBL fold hydrolase [Rugosimonospora africana]
MQIGDVRLDLVADGTFVARPRYFGEDVPPETHPELFGRHQTAFLPIGCFLVRTGDRLVLVDAGLGPEQQDLPHGMHLVGGQLLTGLRALGVATGDITDVVCSHLHADHVGWLFDRDARPVFRNATVWYGAADGDRFVTGPGSMAAHIREGFRDPAHASRLRPIDRDTTVAPGITALPAPGHTPGHLCLVISSGQRRALLLGDAVTCPVQLDESTWHSMSDVDPALAARTRERLWRELEDGNTVGAGAHFPELQFGRVLAGTARRWLT